MKLLALALLLSTAAEALPLAYPRGCRDRSCVRGRAAGAASGPISCGHPGGGPCDAGYPVTSYLGYARGTFGWMECSGFLPVPTVPGFESTSAARYAHVGNVTYDGGMYFDTSITCCKRSGDCVELWGDDPATGNNISESSASANFAADGTGYGFNVEPGAVTQLLHDTIDVSSGWVSNGPALTGQAYPGPFGYFLSGPGGKQMAKLTVVNDGGPQQVCQTVDAGPGTQFAFSCWLHADTIGAARLSLKGTGSSGGDRTLTVTAMSDAGQGRREGVLSLYPGYSGLTALTVCVTAGAANNVSGTLGMSDCQLERDYVGNGRVSMYTPNIGPAGTTVTRNVADFSLNHPVEFDAGQGCLAMGRSERSYDPSAVLGTEFLAYGTWVSTASGTARALCSDTPDLSATRSFDGTNSLASTNPGLQTEGDGGWWTMEVEWDGGTMSQWDGGSLLSSPLAAPLIIEGDRIYLGSNKGVVNASWGGTYGPFQWGNGPMCRAPVAQMPVLNRNGHQLYVIGDGWSGAGTAPKWADYVQGVVTAGVDAVSATTNRWLWDGNQGTGFPDRKTKYGNALFDQEAIWLGYNDLVLDGGFPALLGDVQYYTQREARKGIGVYVFNLAPAGMADDGGNEQTKISTYNAQFRNWCADGGFPGYSTFNRPEPGLTCIDVNALLDPTNSGFVTAAYKGASFLSDAGAQAVGNLFLQSWP